MGLFEKLKIFGANNGTIINGNYNNIGPSQEFIKELSEPFVTQIESLQKDKQLTYDQLLAILKIADDTHTPQAEIIIKLTKLAIDYKKLLDQSLIEVDDDKFIIELKSNSKECLENGDLDGAKRFLSDAEKILSKNDLKRTKIISSRAELLLLEFDFLEASRLYRKAANIISDDENLHTDWFDYACSSIEILNQCTLEFGKTQGHRKSINLIEDFINEKIAAKSAKYLPLFNNLLGNALVLEAYFNVEREILEKAKTAYSDALAYYEKFGSNDQITTLLANMAAIDFRIGITYGDVNSVKLSAKKYEEVLELFENHKSALIAVDSFCVVLNKLAEMDGNLDYSRKAIKFLKTALMNLKSNDDDNVEAGLRVNLGINYYTLGVQSNDSVQIKKSIKEYNEAIDLISTVEFPLSWAGAKFNLGNAKIDLAIIDQNIKLVEEAIDDYRDSLIYRTETNSPLDWAASNSSLATALIESSGMTSKKVLLEEAIGYLDSSLKIFTVDTDPAQYALTKMNLGVVYSKLFIFSAQSSKGQAMLDVTTALDFFREAQEVFKAIKNLPELAKTSFNIAVTEFDQAYVFTNKKLLVQSIRKLFVIKKKYKSYFNDAMLYEIERRIAVTQL